MIARALLLLSWLLLLMRAVVVLAQDPATTSGNLSSTTASSTTSSLASVTDTQPSATQVLPFAFPNDSTYLEVPPGAVSTSVSFNFNNSVLDEAACWYPVSGNYGRLPRILFYITIVFALVARTHPWLIAGALAAAFTYSGSAAIHGALMVWRGPGYGDLDIVPILGILSTACLISVPLLNWSRILRDLGKEVGPDGTPVKHDGNSPTRTVIICWGFLVTIGFLCIFVALWDPHVSAFALVELDTTTTFSCSPLSGVMNMTVGQMESWNTFRVTTEWVEGNNCNTPCVKPSPAGAIFRTDNDLTTINMDRLDYLLQASHPQGHTDLQFVEFYISVGLCLLPFILLQGMFAASFGRRAPSDIRDLIFLESYQRRFPFASRGGGPWQRRMAKTGAVAAYLWALFMAVLCPPLFVLNLVAVELFINKLPESEDHTHIGAWSPYASTGLVLFAAFVARYHNALSRFVVHGLSEFGWRIGHIWRHFRRFLARMARRSSHGTDEDSLRPRVPLRLHSDAPYPLVVEKGGVNAFLQLKEVIDRYMARVKAYYQRVNEELLGFVQFYRDPEETALKNIDKALKKGGGVDIIRRARGTKHSQPYHGITQPLPTTRPPAPSYKEGDDGGRPFGSPALSPSTHGQHHLYRHDGAATFSQSRYTSFISGTPGYTFPRTSPAVSMSSSPRASSAVLPGRPSTRTKAPSSSSSLDEPPLPPLPIPVINHQPPDSGLSLQDSISATISTRQRRSNLYAPNAQLDHSDDQRHPLPHSSPGISSLDSPTSASGWPLPTHSRVSSLPPTGDAAFLPFGRAATSPAPSVAAVAAADDDDNLSASPAFNMARFSSSPAHVRELLRAQREFDGVARVTSPAPLPRLGAVRSTVSYLQVQRPETMAFGDEVRLRKDEWGVYHVVIDEEDGS